MVEIRDVPEEIAEAVDNLRGIMARHGFAFGAVYCAKRGEGDVLLLAENMPAHGRVNMLRNLIAAAFATIKRFQV